MPVQQTDSIKEVIFSSRTRGASESIRLTPDSVIVEKTGSLGPQKQAKAITNEEWQQVLKSLQGVTLSNIEELPSPTHQRERDAAMHSTISITTTGNTYTSSTFDGHHPPKPLQPLMSVMEQLSGSKQ